MSGLSGGRFFFVFAYGVGGLGGMVRWRVGICFADQSRRRWVDI